MLDIFSTSNIVLFGLLIYIAFINEYNVFVKYSVASFSALNAYSI